MKRILEVYNMEYEQKKEKKIKSMEEYSREKYLEQMNIEEDSEEAKAIDRNAYRGITTQIKKALQSIGLEMESFKVGKTYEITEEFERMYDYLEKYFCDRYKKALKNQEFEIIPEEDKIILRRALIEAYSSMRFGTDKIKEEIIKYEVYIECPPSNEHIPFTEITYDMLTYCKDIYIHTYQENIPEEIWYKYELELRYRFRTEWRPQLLDIALREFKKFIENYGKPYEEECLSEEEMEEMYQEYRKQQEKE